MRKKIIIITISLLLIISTLIILINTKKDSEWKFEEERPIKIFILNSYNPDTYDWTKEIDEGFFNELKKTKINFETEIYNMDTKNITTEEWKIKTSKEALKKINNWSPDVVYLTDDNAQKYIGKKLLNTTTILIYAGVNGKPEEYGYTNANNVAGILEREHIDESLKLFKKIFPDAKRIGIIGDESETAKYERTNIAKTIGNSDLNFNDYSTNRFDKYKKKILEYNENVDAILVLTTQSIKNPRGPEINPGDILNWTTHNNKLPEITLWEHDLKSNLLLGSIIIPAKQGEAAAKLLKKIIIDGKHPNKIGAITINDNKDSVNIKRANELGIDLKKIKNLKQY